MRVIMWKNVKSLFKKISRIHLFRTWTNIWYNKKKIKSTYNTQSYTTSQAQEEAITTSNVFIVDIICCNVCFCFCSPISTFRFVKRRAGFMRPTHLSIVLNTMATYVLEICVYNLRLSTKYPS